MYSKVAQVKPNHVIPKLQVHEWRLSETILEISFLGIFIYLFIESPSLWVNFHCILNMCAAGLLYTYFSFISLFPLESPWMFLESQAVSYLRDQETIRHLENELHAIRSALIAAKKRFGIILVVQRTLEQKEGTEELWGKAINNLLCKYSLCK